MEHVTASTFHMGRREHCWQRRARCSSAVETPLRVVRAVDRDEVIGIGAASVLDGSGQQTRKRGGP